MEEIIVYFKCKKDNLKEDGKKYPLLEKRERYGHLFWMVILPFSELEMKRKKPQTVKRKISRAYKGLQGKMDAAVSDIWYEASLQEYLQYERPVFPVSFISGIYQSCHLAEQLFLRDGEEALSFAQRVYGRLNALAIYTENEEKWEDFIEEAYEQTGLIVTCNCFCGKKEGVNTYLFDLSETDVMEYRTIPQNTVYIDFAPTKQKRRILLAKRKDITYCTYAKFLDTEVLSKV